MSRARFKNLRPGACFIHQNDIYIKTLDYGNADAVNMRSGEFRIFLPYSRVTQIHLNLQIVDPSGQFDPIDAGAVWRSQ